MTSLNMGFKISFLCEGILTIRTHVGSLSRVLLHVNLQRILLIKWLPTHKAGKGSFSSVHPHMSHKLRRFQKLLIAHIANFLLLVTGFLSGVVLLLVLLDLDPVGGEEVLLPLLLRPEHRVAPGADVHLGAEVSMIFRGKFYNSRKTLSFFKEQCIITLMTILNVHLNFGRLSAKLNNLWAIFRIFNNQTICKDLCRQVSNFPVDSQWLPYSDVKLS